MNKQFLIAGIAALTVTLGVIQVRGAESEVSVPLGKVPANVRATIEKQAKGAKIRGVEIVTTKVYEVEITKNGKTTEFSVSLDGRFLGVNPEEAEEKPGAKQAKKSEAKEDDDEKDDEKAEAKEKKSEGKQAKKSEAKEDDDEKDDEKSEAKEKKSEGKQAKKSEAKEDDDEKDDEKGETKQNGKAPGPVQAMAKKLIGKGKLLSLAHESDGNYELDYQVNGVHRAAIIAPDGKVQEEEVTVEASTLPKAVMEAVKKLYPKGKITLAEKSTTKDGIVYELEVSIKKSVSISPEGKVQ